MVPAEVVAAREIAFWPAAQEELALLREIGAGFEEKDFLAGIATPVLLGAALCGARAGRLLDALVDLAPDLVATAPAVVLLFVPSAR